MKKKHENGISKYVDTNFVERVRISGKVTYSEYVEYLNKKSENEVKAIYIEMTIQMNRVNKLNQLLGFTAIISIIVSIILTAKKFIENTNTNLADVFNQYITVYILLFYFTLIVVLFLLFLLLLNIELNKKRKILIIEEYLKTEG